jgi:hypothetical protein
MIKREVDFCWLVISPSNSLLRWQPRRNEDNFCWELGFSIFTLIKCVPCQRPTCWYFPLRIKLTGSHFNTQFDTKLRDISWIIPWVFLRFFTGTWGARFEISVDWVLGVKSMWVPKNHKISHGFEYGFTSYRGFKSCDRTFDAQSRAVSYQEQNF